MGCAEEALTDILSYLHREYLHPNYLEEYFLLANEEGLVDHKTASDYKFEVNKQLDGQGCAPKCPAHLTFGLDFCEISACKKCDIMDNVSQIKREFTHSLYIDELLKTRDTLIIEGVKGEKIDLSMIIKTIIKGENEFHMGY
jgi:hypothetical protein